MKGYKCASSSVCVRLFDNVAISCLCVSVSVSVCTCIACVPNVCECVYACMCTYVIICLCMFSFNVFSGQQSQWKFDKFSPSP